MFSFKTMEVVFLLFLAAVTRAEIHSLQFSYTGSSGLSDLPEFMAVISVDEVQTSYCDSTTRRALPRQDWVDRITAVDPYFWTLNTDCVNAMHTFKASIGSLNFKETGGVHTYQRMFGCEWDDETDGVRGFEQHGYDGEDFLSFDQNTQTWDSHTPKANATKCKWDRHRSQNKYLKIFLTLECPEQLKKYLDFGRSALSRKDLPSMYFLQKTSSSPISCLATGFYPDKANLFWRKDGEQLYEDVLQGEILPNHDGTFQMSVDLMIALIAPEDLTRYECVFEISGINADIVTKLDQALIRPSEAAGLDLIYIPIIGVVIGVKAGLIYASLRARAMLYNYRRI